jgi:SRSO17 transposase
MTDLIETVPPIDLARADSEQLVEALRDYHAIYRPLLPRREQRPLAQTSLQGLLSEWPRQSIAPMVLALTGVNPNAVRAMQSFISAGAWDDDTLLHQHWTAVETDLGTADGVLLVDGSACPTHGSHAAGVKRQDCGELGKRATCQAGVFLGSGRRTGSTLLERRLSLPEAWGTDAADATRRTPGGIAEPLPFTTTPELAREMSTAVVNTHPLRCRWVVADAACGADPAFLEGSPGTGCGTLPQCHTVHGSGVSAQLPRCQRGAGADAARSGPGWWRGLQRRTPSESTRHCCPPRRGRATPAKQGGRGRWWPIVPQCG